MKRTTPLKRKSKTPRAKAIARADAAWALNAKHRAGWKCEVCGKLNGLETHHFRPKVSFTRLRYDRRNAVVLCGRHHRYDAECSAHGDAGGFALWFQGVRTDDFLYLMRPEHRAPLKRTAEDLLEIAHSFELDNKLYSQMAA